MNQRLALAMTVAALLALASDRAEAQQLTLTEAAQAALATHPTIAASAARIMGAQEGSAAARARRLPSLQLDASLTQFEEPMIVSPLHSLNLSTTPRFDETLIQGRLGMGYTLFDGGARSANIDAATELVEIAKLGAVASEMALLEMTASAFHGLIAARAITEGAQTQLTALNAEYQRAEQSLEAGTAARVEVLRAGAAREEARAQLSGALARVEVGERNLARLMGVEPVWVSGRTLASSRLPTPAPTLETRRSPLVGRAARSVDAAAARRSAERATRLPRLDLGAGVLDFGTLSGRHVFEWQAGVQVSWPLFTGGARNAAVRRADADVRVAQAELSQAELDVQAMADAAAAAIREADARAEALESAVTQWEEVARIEALALEAGSGVQSDLLRAQAGLFQARAGLARARADAAVARASLARAAGILDADWFNTPLENEG